MSKVTDCITTEEVCNTWKAPLNLRYGISSIEKKADEMEVGARWAIRRRIVYLRDQIKELQADIEDMLSTDITDPFKLALYNNMASEKLDIMIAAIRQMKACEKRIANMDKEIKDDITDDMIGRAKQYPIDQLIKFERGKATAWCHDDKHPSLSHDRKRNRARCFPCDKSFDSIAVLVDRDGMGFKEAVKWLAGN